jgi:hypothetical protein
LFLAILFLAGNALAKDKPQAKRRPSTAEERSAAAKAARELENDPLGPKAGARTKVAKVVLEAPDIQVKICANMLVSFANEKSPRHSLLLMQIFFSTMAFMIENPDRAGDDQAGYMAGIFGALKAYRTIHSVEPKSRSEYFDKLLELKKPGELEDHLQKESAACVPQP